MAGILLGEFYEKARDKCGISADTVTWRIFQILRTFVLVTIGRYFSRASQFMAAVEMFRLTSRTWWDLSFIMDGSLIDLGLDNANWIVLLVAVMVLFVVDFLHERGVQLREGIARQSTVFRWTIYIAAVICVLIFGIYGPEYNATSFIYEQF